MRKIKMTNIKSIKSDKPFTVCNEILRKTMDEIMQQYTNMENILIMNY